jgi:hypothetical protein
LLNMSQYFFSPRFIFLLAEYTDKSVILSICK